MKMAKFGNYVCCLRVGVLWGVGIISSQVFGHLRSFKGWIQTEACVIPITSRGRNIETNRDIISVAVVPSKQKLFVQPKLEAINSDFRGASHVQHLTHTYTYKYSKYTKYIGGKEIK